jgi:VanZ family protein
MDVLSNSLGSALGGFLCYLISTRISVTPRILNRLRLETPLMALTYLLVPLLWIDTLAIPEAPYRWILTTIIGIFGAIIFSNLFRHWEQVVDHRVVGYAALAAGLWFSIGAGPSVLHPHGTILIAFGVMLVAAVLTVLPQSNQDRRFERQTLMRLAPMIALYLVLLSLVFPLSPFGTWHGFLGFTDRNTETSLYDLYPRLEYLAAYTVLGYLIAEWRGRLELPLMKDLPRLLFLATGIALLLEILSGFQSGRGASLVRLLLAVAGAVFGGTIYHLSRAHIRYLLGR